MSRHMRKDTDDGLRAAPFQNGTLRVSTSLHLIALKRELRTEAIVHEYVCEYLGGKDVGELSRE